MKKLCVVVALLACIPALAANPMAGTWRGSSAAKIIIPDGSGSFFNLVFETHSGERFVFKATWVKPGSQFSWVDKQNTPHTATLVLKDPVRIKDVNSAYPNSPAYWYRLK